MKKTVLLAAFFALLLGCTRSEWQELRSDQGGFAVLMRAEPQYVNQQLDTPAGKMSAFLYSSDRPDSYFAVGYTDYPLALVLAGSADGIFAGARDTWVKRIEGRLLGSSPLSLTGKYPGLEFTAEGRVKGADTFLHGRLYLVDQRLYQTVAMGRKGEVSQGVINRFQESFRLIPITDTGTIQLKPPPVK